VFLRSSLGRLRAIGLLEGLSFLVLLGIAMPLKYLAGMPEMVSVVGMAHGVLFMLFFLAVVQVAVERRWPLTRVVVALAASVLPFGPFVLDARLLRRELEAEAQARPGSALA
jgi:integral membrane protein